MTELFAAFKFGEYVDTGDLVSSVAQYGQPV